MRSILSIVLASTLTVAAGCSLRQSLQNPGAPDQSFDEDKDIQALEDHYGGSSGITKYYELAGQGFCSNESAVHCSTRTDCPAVTCVSGSCSNDPKMACTTAADCPLVTCAAVGETKTARNEIIVARLTMINLQYIKFIRRFSATKAQLDTALDLLITGVGLATAATGGEAAKAALGAASAGLGAARLSIDKNFFYEKTVPVLINSMNAARKVALIPILAGIRQDLDNYQLGQALSDLSEYYFAGTFVGALQAIQKDAGAKEAEADQRIERIQFARTPEAAAKLASQPVIADVRSWQTKIDALTDPQALALAKSPPVADRDKLATLVATAFPHKEYETNPTAARAVLKMRTAMMIDPDTDVPAWEKALP